MNKIIDYIFYERNVVFTTAQDKRAGEDQPRRYRHESYRLRWSKNWTVMLAVRVR